MARPSLPVIGHSLREGRASVLAYGLGLGLWAFVIALFYPSLEEARRAQEQLLASYPKELLALFGISDAMAIFTPEGFLHGELFAFMAPLLVLVQAIAAGAHAVAGEEERGTLELVLAQPVSRFRYYAERLVALWLQLAGTGVLLLGGTMAGAALVDMPIASQRLMAAVTNTVLLGWLFGTLSLAAGAATGRRRAALGLAVLLAVVSYFLSSIAPLVDWLEPLQPASPYYQAVGYRPLEEGFAPGRAALLLAATLIVAAAGAVGFRRRDLGV